MSEANIESWDPSRWMTEREKVTAAAESHPFNVQSNSNCSKEGRTKPQKLAVVATGLNCNSNIWAPAP